MRQPHLQTVSIFWGTGSLAPALAHVRQYLEQVRAQFAADVVQGLVLLEWPHASPSPVKHRDTLKRCTPTRLAV